MSASVSEVEVVPVKKPQKILVMTDLHIRGPGQKIIGLDPLEKLELALVHSLALHRDAAALIITGDLSHSGKVEEYQRLNNALQLARNAGVPVYLMLGNHDNREAFLSVFPDTELTPEGHVQSTIDMDTHRCIMLDSLDGPPFSRATNWGLLCSARLAWLEAELMRAQADNTPVLIFIHQVVF